MKLARHIHSFPAMLAPSAACVALPVPGAAEPAKVFRVEARTTTFGGTGYVLGFGACDILNKKSPWVRGSVLDSSGTPENIKVVGTDPKKRNHTFFTTSYEMFELAQKGEGLFRQDGGKYKDLQVMINEQKLVAYIITLDPAIRTLDQLRGKRVATWGKGTTKYEMTYNLIAGAGKDVVDSIRWQHTGYNGYDDMISGREILVPGELRHLSGPEAGLPPRRQEVLRGKGHSVRQGVVPGGIRELQDHEELEIRAGEDGDRIYRRVGWRLLPFLLLWLDR